MKHLLPLSLLTHFFLAPDAGSGTGGDGSASGTGAAGAGGQAGAAGASGGTGAAAAVKLTADSLVDFGDGKPVKWSEATARENGRFVAREDYDRGVKYLEQVAGNLDTREQQLINRLQNAQQGRNAQGGELQPTDPFATLEGEAIIDGKTLANLARQLVRDGFGRQAQIIAGLAQKVTALEKGNGQLAQQTSQLTDRDYREKFDQAVTDVLTKLTPEGLPQGVTINPQDPFLRELAADTWYSHDENSWKRGEYETLLGARIKSAVEFVRRLDKGAVEYGNKRRQDFLRNPRKGNGTPSGQSGYRHQNGTDLADMLFHGRAAAGT